MNNNVQSRLQQAIAALQEGQLEVAERQALAVRDSAPALPDAYHLLGLIARQRRQIDAACGFYAQALERAGAGGAAAVILANWGNALLAGERCAEAVERFVASLERDPEAVAALVGYGDALRRLSRLAESEEVLCRAIDLQPHSAMAHVNLGATWQALGRLDEAAEAYRQAIRFDPREKVAHYNLGCLLVDAGRNREAMDCLSAAVNLDPAYADASAALLRLSQSVCQWDVSEPLEMAARERVAQGGTVFPFAFLALSSTSAEQQACARQWAARRFGHIQPRWLHVPRQRQPGEKLRIGYLSSDLHDHATAFLMAEVFERHDRQRYEIIAYSSSRDDGGQMRQRLRRAFDGFVDILALTDEAAARRIHDDRIDILIDLKGYTRDSRTGVLAYRPAPVQAQYLGYPGTLGAAFVDYVITDEVVTPDWMLPCYDEAPAYLPGSYQCNDRQRPLLPAPSREACGLPEKGVIFCCFNHTYKIRREVFAVWCELLRAVPESILWLLRSNELAESNLRAAAQAAGVDPERLRFADVRPLPEHLARLANADVFLDTQPYNAHTTASDALWVGVPVIAWQGETFASRVSSSLLRAVGLDGLVATDAAQYQALAIRLATDPAWRASLKQQLVDQRMHCRLFDSQGFTSDLEALYEAMFACHAAGQLAAPIRLQQSIKGNETVQEDYKELMIGAGSSRVKKLFANGRQEWSCLQTLDINADHKPDLVWDLTELPLPYADNEFNEIHAYEVLEHTGRQGDYKFFFAQFSEFWRILRPDGLLIGTCPSRNSPWAWGDPSHTRVIQPENFVFLNQQEYIKQVGVTAMSDFRYIYQADFTLVFSQDDGTTFSFALKAVKPSRFVKP